MNAISHPRTFLRLITSLLILFVIVLTACNNDDEEEMINLPMPEESEQPFDDVVLSSATVFLNEASLAQLEAAGENGQSVTFSGETSQLASVEEGSVLIIGITDATPFGALLKVTSVSPTGDGYHFTTEPAKLTDAFEEAHIQFSRDLTLDDFDSVALGEGVTLGTTDGRTEGDGLTFIIEHEIKASPNERIEIEGRVTIDPDMNFELDMAFFDVEKMKFSMRLNETVEIETSYIGKFVGFKRDFDLVRLTGKSFFISGLYITPVFEVEMGISGEIAVSMQYGFTQSGYVEAGALYENNGWEAINSRAFDFDGDVGFPQGVALAGVSIGPEIEAMFYGIIGVELEGLEASAQATVNVANPARCWEIEAWFGVQPEIEIESEFFDIDREFEIPLVLEIARTTVASDTCEPPGQIAGLVKDAITDEPVAGVTVQVLAEDQLVAETTTDAQGNYQTSLPAGDYTVEFSKEGYLSERMFNVSVESNDIQFLDAVLQIGEDYRGTGAITGILTDAVTGQPIAGARLTIRRGLGQTAGASVATTVSSTDGRYSVTDLEAGNYTVLAEADGYVSGIFNVVSIGGQTTFNQNGSLSPILEAGQIRIILSWGENPRDLDSHLTGPTENGSRFHTYWKDMTPAGSNTFLDIDDTTSYGPETITVEQTQVGLYRYSVHDYTNRNQTVNPGLGRSGAKVRVLMADLKLAEYNIPNQPGNLWTVFEMKIDENGNPQFTTVNAVSDVSSEDAVQRQRPTDKHWLRQLPEK